MAIQIFCRKLLKPYNYTRNNRSETKNDIQIPAQITIFNKEEQNHLLHEITQELKCCKIQPTTHSLSLSFLLIDCLAHSLSFSITYSFSLFLTVLHSLISFSHIFYILSYTLSISYPHNSEGQCTSELGMCLLLWLFSSYTYFHSDTCLHLNCFLNYSTRF